jgi:hypothetical protein
MENSKTKEFLPCPGYWKQALSTNTTKDKTRKTTSSPSKVSFNKSI